MLREAIRSASLQFVARGCCPGGRPSYHTRHCPGGGICPGGIPWFRELLRPLPCAKAEPAIRVKTAIVAAALRNMIIPVVITVYSDRSFTFIMRILAPWGPAAAGHYAERAVSIEYEM